MALRIEIAKINGKLWLRIGDLDGVIESINFSKDGILKEISEEIDKYSQQNLERKPELVNDRTLSADSNSNKCIFFKEGRCNSDYGKTVRCDGIKNSEDCPYNSNKIAKPLWSQNIPTRTQINWEKINKLELKNKIIERIRFYNLHLQKHSTQIQLTHSKKQKRKWLQHLLIKEELEGLLK